jgi:SAM-dependent methyltransferase
MPDLLDSVKEWFNRSSEVEFRIQELAKGLTEPEHKMLRYLPAESRILDIGCAAGRVSIALAQEGHTVVGVDVAENLIEKARRVAKEKEIDATFRVCDPANLPFSDGQFDAVLLLKTYCYIPKRENRIAWLNEIGRVMRSGGWLFLSQYIIDDVLGSYAPIREDNQNRFPGISETLEEGDNFSLPAKNDKNVEVVHYVHHFMEADLLDELRSSRFQIVDTFREETICYCCLKQ